MLVLTRKPREGLVFDDGRVRIHILGVVGSRVKLGVEAPRDVRVMRDELILDEQPALTASTLR